MPEFSLTQPLESLVDALSDVVRSNRHLAVDIARTAGFSPSQIAVIGVLGRLGESRIAELADELFVDPSVVSRHVAPLEQGGCIERRTDPTDGRASLIRLTDLGEEMRSLVRTRRREHLEQALTDWSPEQVDTLTDALTTISAALGQRIEHPVRSERDGGEA